MFKFFRSAWGFSSEIYQSIAGQSDELAAKMGEP